MMNQQLLAKLSLTLGSSDEQIKGLFAAEHEKLKSSSNISYNLQTTISDDELRKYSEEFSPYPVFLYAYKRKASDIAFIPYPPGAGKVNDNTKVYLKVDGFWELVWEIDRELHLQYINAIKNWAIKGSGNLKTANQRIPQDGKGKLYLFNSNKEIEKAIELRLAFAPQHITNSQGTNLEACVIRLLDNGGNPPLEKAGFSMIDLKKFNSLEKMKKGLVLISGPTGSGKSSTLFGFIDRVNNGTRRIYTVENPVEFDVPGVSQLDVQPNEDISDSDEVTFNFTRASSFLMRAAPDIILVGEIRSFQTAKTAVDLANTGHISLATVHTNSALQSIDRLLGFKSPAGDKIPRYSIVDSLKYVSAQMLSPKLCPHCKIKLKQIIGQDGKLLDLGDHILNQAYDEMYTSILSQTPAIITMMQKNNLKRILGDDFCKEENIRTLILESYLPNLNGCDHCTKRQIITKPDGTRVLGMPSNKVGFKGRVLLNESILLDRYIKSLLLQDSPPYSTSELLDFITHTRYELKEGELGHLDKDLDHTFYTMYQDGLLKALLPGQFLAMLYPSYKANAGEKQDDGLISVLDAKQYGAQEG